MPPFLLKISQDSHPSSLKSKSLCNAFTPAKSHHFPICVLTHLYCIAWFHSLGLISHNSSAFSSSASQLERYGPSARNPPFRIHYLAIVLFPLSVFYRSSNSSTSVKDSPDSQATVKAIFPFEVSQ